jgi:hypothetical protein
MTFNEVAPCNANPVAAMARDSRPINYLPPNLAIVLVVADHGGGVYTDFATGRPVTQAEVTRSATYGLLVDITFTA